MRRFLLLGFLVGCATNCPNNCVKRQSVPLGSYGRASLKYEVGPNTIIDRGQANPPKEFSGPYIFEKQDWGNVLYIYENNSLRARIINPSNLEFR